MTQFLLSLCLIVGFSVTAYSSETPATEKVQRSVAEYDDADNEDENEEVEILVPITSRPGENPKAKCEPGFVPKKCMVGGQAHSRKRYAIKCIQKGKRCPIPR
ncbi:MAG: hypothetical protein AB7O96_02765 [Pseudobdellovibrionaceae bacterium]